MIYFVYIFTQIDVMGLNTILPQIVFLVMAAFRILPGINRIILNAQTLRKNLATIKNIHNEKLISQSEVNQNYKEDFTFNKSMNFENVSFRYNENYILKILISKFKRVILLDFW